MPMWAWRFQIGRCPSDGRASFGDRGTEVPSSSVTTLRPSTCFVSTGRRRSSCPVFWGGSGRSAIRGSLYFSHLPAVPNADLRVEGVYTDLPAGGALSHGFFYWNDRYLNGYTSNNQLLGSWIGRQGQGAQVWTNYWFSARNRLQFNYRHQKVSQQFIPGGGTLTDVGVRNDYWLRPNFGLSTWAQYERWLFPVIQ